MLILTGGVSVMRTLNRDLVAETFLCDENKGGVRCYIQS